jgi:DNA-binding transcriptional LysR family regulator
MNSKNDKRLEKLPSFDWDKAKNFYYIAKLENMTEAAKQLNITQSSLSRQLTLLEESLRCKLFIRTGRGVKMTRKGEEFFSALEKAFFALREFSYSHAATSNEGKKRKIRISTTHLIAGYIIDEYLFEYNKLHPEILFETIADDHLIDIIINDVDIAICPYDPETKGIHQEYLFTLEKKLFASPAYLDKHGEPKIVEDLKNHFIINYPKKDNLYPYSDLDWALALGMKKEETMEPIYTTSSIQSFFRAAEIGVGIIPSYEHLKIIKDKGFKNIVPTAKAPKVDWYLTYPKYLKKDQELQNLKTYLFNMLQSFRAEIKQNKT